MKLLIKITFIALLFPLVAHSLGECKKCEAAQSLILELENNYKLYIKIQQEHKKHLVQNPVSKERIQFELSMGKAYRFVCNSENNSGLSRKENKALFELVKTVHEINYLAVATSDIFQCFYKHANENKKTFNEIVSSEQKLFEQIMAKGQPHAQDY